MSAAHRILSAREEMPGKKAIGPPSKKEIFPVFRRNFKFLAKTTPIRDFGTINVPIYRYSGCYFHPGMLLSPFVNTNILTNEHWI
jgi:hypothetical protein